MAYDEKLVNKNQFAKIAGVSPTAIYLSCGKGALAPTLVGTRINMNHPVAIEYLNTKRADDSQPIDDASKVAPHIRGHPAKKANEKLLESENNTTNNITEYLDLTLRELISRFGTDVRFVDWLKAVKSIEDINEKRLKNAITESGLVNIKLVKNFVLDPMNSMHIKLLGSGSKTLSLRIKAKVEAGDTEYEIEKLISRHIAGFIKPLKAKIKKLLKND